MRGVRGPRPRRPFHDQEARLPQVLDQAFGRDVRHRFVGGVHALSPLKAQREGERLLHVVDVGGGEGAIVGHAGS